ncbi:MAG: transglycosylase domain-containing protein [Bacillota bacterium]
MSGDLKKNIKIFLLFLLIVIAIEFSAVFLYSYKVVSQPVTFAVLEKNSFIYDRYGNKIANLQGKISREPVALERVPQHVKDAFVAIEDERFYMHGGVDLRAILRAFFGNVREGEIVQGGSTITQQVVKTHYLSSEKTYYRKFREALLSLQFENTHSKDEILEIYLNDIYLGEGAYGVQAASKVIFNKDISELTLAEGALLAGITQAPSIYNPYVKPEEARQRRNIVIDKMVELGLADLTSAREARTAPFKLRDRRLNYNKAGELYYIDHVIEEAVRLVGNDAVFGGGINIKTSFDPVLQSEVDRALSAEKFQDEKIQYAFVLLDSKTGEVLAMIGGRSYEAARGFNRATQLKRQPGSAMKPVAVYGPAFEQGYNGSSIVEDSPRSWGRYTPRNYDGGHWGPLTIESALQWSRNVAAVWLLDRIGIERGYEFATRLGIKLDKEDRHLALALGGLTRGVSPLEMAGAYACFANGGFYSPPHVVTAITDSEGRELYRTPDPSPVMKPATATLMTEMLKSVVRGGTGTAAAIKGYEVSGKTGTTELPKEGGYRNTGGNKDAWFVGYVDRYTGAVWVGYDEKDMNGSRYLTKGGAMAAGIFGRIMKAVLSPESVSRDQGGN